MPDIANHPRNSLGPRSHIGQLRVTIRCCSVSTATCTLWPTTPEPRPLVAIERLSGSVNDACRHSALLDVYSCPAETVGPVVPIQRQMRQVRPQTRGRATELERAAGHADAAALWVRNLERVNSALRAGGADRLKSF
jgi:hypothetical protein